jgi:hypothetical protein
MKSPKVSLRSGLNTLVVPSLYKLHSHRLPIRYRNFLWVSGQPTVMAGLHPSEESQMRVLVQNYLSSTGIWEVTGLGVTSLTSHQYNTNWLKTCVQFILSTMYPNKQPHVITKQNIMHSPYGACGRGYCLDTWTLGNICLRTWDNRFSQYLSLRHLTVPWADMAGLSNTFWDTCQSPHSWTSLTADHHKKTGNPYTWINTLKLDAVF